MQNMEVYALPEQKELGSGPGSEVRYVDASAVLFHYAHIKERERFASRCGYCCQGVAAVFKSVHPAGVVSRDRVDQEGATSPTRSVGAGAGVRGGTGYERVSDEDEPSAPEDRGRVEDGNRWW